MDLLDVKYGAGMGESNVSIQLHVSSNRIDKVWIF